MAKSSEQAEAGADEPAMSDGLRVAAWACIFVSAASSMLISYAGLAGLARLVGYTTVTPGIDTAALLPVAIDVAIVASTLVWLGQGAPAHTRSYARGLALATIATSVVANGAYHGLTGGGAAGSWWLASLVGSVPPASLAALVHLGALLVRSAPAPGARSAAVLPVPEPSRQVPAPVPGDVAPAAPEPGEASGDDPVTSADLLAKVAEILDTAEAAGLRPPGRTLLARQLDVSPHEARLALERLRQEREGQLVPAPSAGA